MPFMVMYSTSDGTSCHEQADAIDEAALFVERLRNQDGIEEVRLYRMEEISFAFRPYYKVELGMPERCNTEDVVVVEPAIELDRAADLPAAPTADALLDAPAGMLAHEDADPSGANDRRGLFGR
jgi:hypothetical protein